MITMQLALNIDAQKFLQQVRLNNQELEEQVEAGINRAISELSEDGKIEQMIVDAAKKAIMDSFSKWIFQSNIRQSIEKSITGKMSKRIDNYVDKLINELAEKLNLPKED